MLHLYRGKRIAVVVPAYNESRFILDTVKAVPGLVDIVYVVDDGSTDNTLGIVMELKSDRVRIVKHDRNRGVGAAVTTGYLRSLEDDIDIVAVMAGDNQMDPRHLPRLLNPLVDNIADYSKGNRLAERRLRTTMPMFRTFGNFVLSVMTKIASGYWHISDSQNGYTAISRRTLQSLDLNRVYPYYGYCNDLLIKLGTGGHRVVDVPMDARYGSERSKIRYGSYIARVGSMIVRGGVMRFRRKFDGHERL